MGTALEFEEACLDSSDDDGEGEVIGMDEG